MCATGTRGAKGHPAYFTFAALDVPKEQERGNDNHGSKILVVPFDGVRFDREMQRIVKAEERSAKGVTRK